MTQVKGHRLALEYRFPNRWLWGRRFMLRRLARSFECYHPVELETEQLAPGQRACHDRWQMIDKILGEEKAETLVDIGCAEGYFVQRAALDHGVLSVGIDADMRRLTMATETCLLNGVTNCGFIYAHIDLNFLDRIPSFDAVLFLSVLHHVMYEHGVDYAAQMMRAIQRKTRKCLVFEMGQSNEKEHSWSTLLPDMGHEPGEWITDFLHRAGWADIRMLGHTDAYQGATKRLVFFARPSAVQD